MSTLPDSLSQLQKLRQEEALTEAEFAAAKRKLLGGAGGGLRPAVVSTTHEQTFVAVARGLLAACCMAVAFTGGLLVANATQTGASIRPVPVLRSHPVRTVHVGTLKAQAKARAKTEARRRCRARARARAKARANARVQQAKMRQQAATRFPALPPRPASSANYPTCESPAGRI